MRLYIMLSVLVCALPYLVGQDLQLGQDAPKLDVFWRNAEHSEQNTPGENYVLIFYLPNLFKHHCFYKTWNKKIKPELPIILLQYTFVKEGDPLILPEEVEPHVVYHAVDVNGNMYKNYMESFGIKGLPHAFIIQNGKVVWHGEMIYLSNAITAIDSKLHLFEMEQDFEHIRNKINLYQQKPSPSLGKEILQYAERLRKIGPIWQQLNDFYYFTGKINGVSDENVDFLEKLGSILLQYDDNWKSTSILGTVYAYKKEYSVALSLQIVALKRFEEDISGAGLSKKINNTENDYLHTELIRIQKLAEKASLKSGVNELAFYIKSYEEAILETKIYSQKLCNVEKKILFLGEQILQKIRPNGKYLDTIPHVVLSEADFSAENCSTLAVEIVDNDDILFKNATFALKLSRLAYLLGRTQKPNVTSRYARVLYMTGHIWASIVMQKQAIALADDVSLYTDDLYYYEQSWNYAKEDDPTKGKQELIPINWEKNFSLNAPNSTFWENSEDYADYKNLDTTSEDQVPVENTIPVTNDSKQTSSPQEKENAKYLPIDQEDVETPKEFPLE